VSSALLFITFSAPLMSLNLESKATLFLSLSELPEGVEWVASDFSVDHQQLLSQLKVKVSSLSTRAVEKRRREYFAGRWCAAKACFQKTGFYLSPGIHADRSPIWAEGILGSISHSQDKAIALVAGVERCRGIGVDIQDLIPANEQEGIRALILSKAEQALIRSGSIDLGFEIFFSAKESIYKTLYPTSLDMFEHLDVEIDQFDNTNGILELTLQRDLKSCWTKGQRFVVHFVVAESYVLTWVYLPQT